MCVQNIATTNAPEVRCETCPPPGTPAEGAELSHLCLGLGQEEEDQSGEEGEGGGEEGEEERMRNGITVHNLYSYRIKPLDKELNILLAYCYDMAS